MEVHANLLARFVDVNVWRCHMPLARRHLGEMQRPRLVNRVRSLRIVRIRQPDIGALVVCEIQVIAAERLLQPARRPDQRRAVDVLAIGPLQHLRADDGIDCRSDRGQRVRTSVGGRGSRITRPDDKHYEERKSGPLFHTHVIWRSSGRRPRRRRPAWACAHDPRAAGSSCGRDSATNRRHSGPRT